ncbi:hypothetical protein ABZ438_25755 [Streptomyces sp. NPDC005786]|uniref:hypothetical protein n=1 Tax=Streptomyces sp. NPDC005786 TaxID=3154891 RepID=UPI0034079DE9
MTFNDALDAVDRPLIRIPDVDDYYALLFHDLLRERFDPHLCVLGRVVRARERSCEQVGVAHVIEWWPKRMDTLNVIVLTGGF